MRALLPYLALYKRHKWMLSLGICALSRRWWALLW